MHIPFIGPIIIVILFGIALLVIDLLFSKFFNQKRIIIGSIDKILKNISGGNILIELFIILGVPFACIYFLTFFSDNSFGYWLLVAIEGTFFGYLGVKWLENL